MTTSLTARAALFRRTATLVLWVEAAIPSGMALVLRAGRLILGMTLLGAVQLQRGTPDL
jgi:hypothetical protein